MSEKMKARLLALTICALGGFLVFITWDMALHNGRYLVKAAIAGPVTISIGIYGLLSGHPLWKKELNPALVGAGIVGGLGSFAQLYLLGFFH